MISKILRISLTIILSITILILTSTIKAHAVANEFEINDTMDKADRFSMTNSIAGKIYSETDVDWFKFTSTITGSCRIGLSNIPSDVDYDLQLYNSSGGLINTSASTNKYESILYNLSSGQTYYIKVYSYRGYSTTDSYQIRICNSEQEKENWRYMFRNEKMASKITQDYLDVRSDGTYHPGLDIVHYTLGEIANDYPVYSVKSGTVLYAPQQMSNSAGWYVVIKLDSDYGATETVRYLHLKEKSSLSTGDSVTLYTQIGIVGNTGQSTGAHLHFDVNTVDAIYGGSESWQVNSNTTVDPKGYFETTVNFTY